MTSTTRLLTGLLIAALLSTGAPADNRSDAQVINGKPPANFQLGDSKCVLVNEMIRCVPVLMAADRNGV